MKYKYLLRGLGIGVVVTAAVMGAYTRSAVADARVAVMEEYGVGQETTPTLAWNDIVNAETETETESDTQSEPVIVRNEAIESEVESVVESAKASEQAGGEESGEAVSAAEESSAVEEASSSEASSSVESSSLEVSSSESSSSESSSSSEASSSSDAEADNEDVEYIEITIVKGDGSGTASRKLYNAGIVDSATEFDAFLMQHGYDKNISTGVKRIYKTDTWLEIAKKLTAK